MWKEESCADGEASYPHSETSISVDFTVQIHASIRGRDSRSGRTMGLKPIVVFLESVRAAIRLHLHSRQRERYVLPP